MKGWLDTYQTGGNISTLRQMFQQPSMQSNDRGLEIPDPYMKYVDPRLTHELDSLQNTRNGDLIYRTNDPVRDRINYLQQLKGQMIEYGKRKDHIPIPQEYGGDFQVGGSFENYYKTVPEGKNDTSSYNLREYFKRNPIGAKRFATDMEAHAPDSFKLPSHKTFSDESIYFNPATNRDSAGHWLDNMYVPFNPKYRDTVIEKQRGGYSFDQHGGAVSIPLEEYEGLNAPGKTAMTFPAPEDSVRVFRGLDSFAPVRIQDATGKIKVLRGPQDTAKFSGTVKEKMYSKTMKTGGWLDDLPTMATGGQAKFDIPSYGMYKNGGAYQKSKMEWQKEYETHNSSGKVW
jgi:hypothetical protein